MTVYDILDKITGLALNKSKKIYGETNYAYAFGAVVGELQADLDDMCLSKKQLKVLEDRLSKLQKYWGDE